MRNSAVLETQNIERVSFDPVRGQLVGDPVPVTTGTRFWANPDPSPDGASIVVYSQNTPEGDLYVGRSDGTGTLRQLTSDAALDRVPRWSPGGEWIAMFSDRTDQLQVWAIHPDGSELRQLTRTPSGVVAWSPDGRRFAVSRTQATPGEAGAAILDIRGEPHGVTELPHAPPPHSRFTPNAWSADGRRLAGMNGFTTMGIVVYSLDTRIRSVDGIRGMAGVAAGQSAPSVRIARTGVSYSRHADENHATDPFSAARHDWPTAAHARWPHRVLLTARDRGGCLAGQSAIGPIKRLLRCKMDCT